MEKQTSELYRLYRLAAQGDADAQYRLGMRYLNGIGTPQNLRLAYIWVGKAADKGHEQAKQDIVHLRTAGIESAAIAAGIPTDATGIPDSQVPAPAGYQPEQVVQTPAVVNQVQPVVQPHQTSSDAVVVHQPEQIQPIVVQQSETIQPVAAPAVDRPLQSPTVRTTSKLAPIFGKPQPAVAKDTGSGFMKKAFGWLVIILIIIAIGWFFKGWFMGGKGKADGSREMAAKAVILTNKDQKDIAKKVFDKYYGDGTYKNGCWSSNGYCMKFKQVYALPTHENDIYTLNVYAYDAVNGAGRIDAYTVEVDAKTPNDFHVVASRSGLMADPGDGKKTWKFARDGKTWSIDSRRDHDSVRDYLRTTYSLVGQEVRYNRELLKSEPLVVENTAEDQNPAPNPDVKKPEDDKKEDKIEALIKQKDGSHHD